jgi:hypothetical protein
MFNMNDLGCAPALNAQGEALCPLCKQPDSETHVMGGCTSTPELEGLYIKRHDAAVQTIQEGICTGPMGTAAFFMGADRSAYHPDDVLGRGSTFQEWLPVIAPDPAGLSEHPRSLTRPDIVIIKGISSSALRARYGWGERLPHGLEI